MKQNINLVLDTHIWIWWIEQNNQLPARLKILIEDGDTTVAISAVSIYELLCAVARNRLQLDCPPDEWLKKAINNADVMVLPVTPDIATTAARLTNIHGDPLDRLIIATALCHQSQLASLDSNFEKYPELEKILFPLRNKNLVAH